MVARNLNIKNCKQGFQNPPATEGTYNQEAAAQEQITDTGWREQFVKLIMSYSSAWCPLALGNIYYSSITPWPMFSSIKLHHFTLQLAADQLKGRCLYHIPPSQEELNRDTQSVISGLIRKPGTAE